MLVRLAREDDLEAVEVIYTHYVRTSTCTWQIEPGSMEERRAWFAARDERHPVTVAIDGDEVVGFGSLGAFRAREGYRFTVEDTVYVRADRHRRGVGRALLADLVDRACALGHRTIVAGISADQEASVALHAAFGFREVGRLPEVGFKFDRWLDLLLMQRPSAPF